jgi:hypothetical protein
MMDVAGSFTLGTMLVLVLLLWRQSARASRDLPVDSDLLASSDFACGPEFVSRIFSREDSGFIESIQAPHLKRFFRRERKFVALLWIRQNSLRIRDILHEHTALTRHSQDLHFLTELGIFARYVQLRILCGFLFVAITLAGPVWVRSSGLRADALFQNFAKIRESLKDVSDPGQLRQADLM